MSKTIILLSDGTGNAASSPHKTNVWRLYKALDTTEKDQVAFFDDGVGTSSFLPIRLLGLIFGFGLKKNVLQLYESLCRVYRPGDKIAILGFSRGAFTARVLAALIAKQGIVKDLGSHRDLQKSIKNAYRDFRHQAFDPAIFTVPYWWIYRKFLRAPAGENAVNQPQNEDGSPVITFLGVWDTVDAYGAPFDELTRAWDFVISGLTANDRDLSPRIGAAYHALALDEQRESFNPMLWNEAGRENGENQNQTLEQVWFAGVHANVGGGYPDDSLAHVSLNWMIQKCDAHEIKFHEEIVASYIRAADPLGPLYDNRSGMGNMYRYAPRKVEELCNDTTGSLRDRLKRFMVGRGPVVNNVTIKSPKIHSSVFERINRGGDLYSPIGLPEHYCVVKDDGTIVEQPDKPASDNSIESLDQARFRRDQQGMIWRKVWLGKGLYLATIFAIGFYVLFPSWMMSKGHEVSETAKLAGPYLGGIGDVIRAAIGLLSFIPGLAAIDGWAKNYQNFPYLFVFGAFAIAVCIYTGKRIGTGIQSSMRSVWARFIKRENSASEPVPANSLAVRLFDTRLQPSDSIATLNLSVADRIQRSFRFLTECMAALMFFTIACLIIWRGVYVYDAGTGGVCQESNTKKDWTANQATFDFVANSPCFDTGVSIDKDVRYELTFNLSDAWSDATIRADALGWVDSDPWFQYPAAILKRHISKDWYEPIARIGNTQFDRYSISHLERQSLLISGRPVNSATLKFTARSEGRLFLYLNDAVAPPLLGRAIEWWYRDEDLSCRAADGETHTNTFQDSTEPKKENRWIFYRNNCGKAKVTIKRIGKQ